MKKKTVIIAGGGTGGHIYPGVAIARALLQKDPQLDIQFVGSPGGLETKIVPREGFPLHLIRVGKLNHASGWLSKIRTVLGLPLALLQSAALLFEVKPYLVLGVGGFASGPFVLMSSLLGFKSAIWEPNAHPGLTNRWLSLFVRRSLVVFDDAKKYLKSKEVVQMGLPVRREVEDIGGLPQAHEKFNVLIFGGSQGARTVNKVVQDTLVQFSDQFKDMEIIHQTGTHDIEEVAHAYEGHSNYQAMEFLHGMEKYYQWADLVVCRAGASTVAEIAASQKPAILIPLPWAADNHQLKNAQSLVDQKAGVILEQKDLSPESLLKKILEMKRDVSLMKEIKVNLQKFHKPRAADRIAEYLLHIGEKL